MRPKKRILLIDADEERLALRRFLLITHGYLVVEDGPCDLVMGCWPCGPEVLERARLYGSPSLILAARFESPPAELLALAADRTLMGGSEEEIRSTICILSARKRGPKKLQPQPVPA